MKTKIMLLRLLALLFPVRKIRSQRDKKAFAKIWSKIWLEEGYYDHPDQVIDEFSKYDHLSVDFLVKFLGIFPVGTLRLIHYDELMGLPVLNEFEIVEKKWVNDHRIMEVTLLTVKESFRKRFFHVSSLVLMRNIIRYGMKERLEGIVMMADKRLFFLMKRKLSFPIWQIGPEKFYQGSICYPAFIGREEFYETMKKVNPFFIS